MEQTPNEKQHAEILQRLNEISERVKESDDDRKAEKIDYFIALLLGIATILGALAAYYSSIWGGNSAAGYNKATFAVSENSTQYLEGLTAINNMEFASFKDDMMYAEWNNANEKGLTDDADYFKSCMSDEYAAMLDENVAATPEAFDAAVAAWNDAYEVKYNEYAVSIDSAIVGLEKAKALQAESDVQNGHGDNFTFVTVLFTITLFFGGMTAVTKQLKLKTIYAIASLIAFVYSVVSMFMIPFP